MSKKIVAIDQCEAQTTLWNPRSCHALYLWCSNSAYFFQVHQKHWEIAKGNGTYQPPQYYYTGMYDLG